MGTFFWILALLLVINALMLIIGKLVSKDS